jgi:hypothetical protein
LNYLGGIFLFIKMSSTVLTKNGIKTLFGLNFRVTAHHTCEIFLQIILIRQTDQFDRENKNLFSLTLSDGELKYNGFVLKLVKDAYSEKLENYIIQIQSITPLALNNGKNSRVFLIQKYRLEEKPCEPIGLPILLKDDINGIDSGMPKNFIDIHAINNSDQHIRIETDKRSQTIQNNTKVNLLPPSQNTFLNKKRKLEEKKKYYEEESSSSSSEEEDSDEDIIEEEQLLPNGQEYTLLKELSTFSTNFRVLIRVVKKLPIKVYQFAKSTKEGNLFAFDVIDKLGTEMQVVCYSKYVGKYFDIINEGKVYEICGGKVRPNQVKKGKKGSKHQYQIVISKKAKIIEKHDDGTILPKNFKFISISEIQELELKSWVDLIGYVTRVWKSELKNTKNGEEIMLRKLLINDHLGDSIIVNLWRNFAELPICENQVLALKNVTIGEFNDKFVSTTTKSQVFLDPEIKEAKLIKEYMLKSKNDIKIDQIVLDDLLEESEKELEGKNKKKDIVPIGKIIEELDTQEFLPKNKRRSIPDKWIKASVVKIDHSERNIYAGCWDNKCKKKLSLSGLKWKCIKCGSLYQKPAYYYCIGIEVQDCSAKHWLRLFSPLADEFFKVPASDYKDYIQKNDLTNLKKIKSNIEYKNLYFFVKPQLDEYDGKSQRKFIVNDFEHINISCRSKNIIENLATQLKLLEL